MKTLSDILESLIREHPQLLKKDGSINQNAVARFTGVNQPTIKRMLDGESGQPRADNIEKLARSFGCSQAVIRGEAPISPSYSPKAPTPETTPSIDPEKLWEMYQSLPEDAQKMVYQNMLTLKSLGSKNKK